MCCWQRDVITPGVICPALSSCELQALPDVILFLKQPVYKAGRGEASESPQDSVVTQRLGPLTPFPAESSVSWFEGVAASHYARQVFLSDSQGASW